jgi:hypothetical protein
MGTKPWIGRYVRKASLSDFKVISLSRNLSGRTEENSENSITKGSLYWIWKRELPLRKQQCFLLNRQVDLEKTSHFVKKVFHVLRVPSVQHRVHNSPSLLPDLKQVNPVDHDTLYLFKVLFRIALPSTLTPHKFLPLWDWIQNFQDLPLRVLQM